MLVNYLRENRVLVLIDSLEKLLTVNDTENSNNFADEWWDWRVRSSLSDILTKCLKALH